MAINSMLREMSDRLRPSPTPWTCRNACCHELPGQLKRLACEASSQGVNLLLGLMFGSPKGPIDDTVICKQLKPKPRL